MLAFVLGLASTFIKALVTSAGSAVGQKLVESASSRGAASGAAPVFPVGVPTNPTQQVQSQRALIKGLTEDEELRNKVHATVRDVLPEADDLIRSTSDVFERQPNLVEAAVRGDLNLFDLGWIRESHRRNFGFSEEQLDFLHVTTEGASSYLSRRCPIGGETLPFAEGVRYRDGDDKEVHPWTFKEYMNMQGEIVRMNTVVATCTNGHAWRVFAM